MLSRELISKREELYSKYEKLYPKKENVFNFLKYLNFKDLFFIGIGQDVYPNDVEGEPVSNGIAFFTDIENHYPYSFKELFYQFKAENYQSIDKTGKSYAQKGMLWFNVGLSVIPYKPMSLINEWEDLTKRLLIRFLLSGKDLILVNFGSVPRNLTWGVIQYLKGDYEVKFEGDIRKSATLKIKNSKIEIYSFIHPANRYAKKEERLRLRNWIDEVKSEQVRNVFYKK